jgi:hypothetical protein
MRTMVLVQNVQSLKPIGILKSKTGIQESFLVAVFDCRIAGLENWCVYPLTAGCFMALPDNWACDIE